MEKKWISLNVGGTVFTSMRSTLTRATPPNSPLHRISTHSTNVIYDRDEKGAYLIDRDPQYFQTILNYLRTRKLVLPAKVTEEAILLEAEYFNIPDLVKLLRNQICERNLAQLQQQQQQHHTDFNRPLSTRAAPTLKPPTMDPATLAELANELQQFAENL